MYYALPLEYVTVSQLQTKLGDGVNHLSTRKLIEKMASEGYVEGTAINRKMGMITNATYSGHSIQ